MFEESLVVFGKDCKLTEVTEHRTHTKTSTESENVRHTRIHSLPGGWHTGT